MLKTGEMCLIKKISFYIISLGCSKNLVDSERINGAMISADLNLPIILKADIVIINTLRIY
jgi:tRNA A37 methylthiotransferase MiaB